jgi:tRNA A37 threonylcarbamoyladenosine biosynthesis protein TsaE
MNFFMQTDEEIEDQKLCELYKKKITKGVKDDNLNLLEFSYLIDYEKDGGTLINSNWYTSLINKLNDTELNDVVLKRIKNIYRMDDDGKLIGEHTSLAAKLIKEKRNTILFTSDQKRGIKKICKFLPDYTQKIFGLYGYAGTGKTTTIVEIITYLLKHNVIKSVVFTAPTNKAVSVIKAKFRMYLKELYNTHVGNNMDEFDFEDALDELHKKNIRIEFTTLHKLLKYETDIDLEGELIFIRGNGNTLINQYELVIIDECSMIPLKIVDQILNEVRGLNKQSDNYKKIPKIIFSGDPAQLPPVHEKQSTIFLGAYDEKTMRSKLKIKDYVASLQGDMNESSMVKKHNMFVDDKQVSQYDKKYGTFINDILQIDTYTLTKVMRSRLDAVTQVCYEIRQWTMGDISFPNLGKYAGEEGVKFYENNNNKSKLVNKWFKKCIKYHKKGNCNIILTWTNKQADEYNQAIRSTLFNKTDLERFEVNDILMLSNFYNIDDGNIDYITESKFHTSEQIKIIKVEQVKKDVEQFPLVLNKQARKLQNFKQYEQKYKDIITKIHSVTQMRYDCWKLFVQRVTEDNTKDNINKSDDDLCVIYVVNETSKALLESEKGLVIACIKKLRSVLISKFKEKSKQIEMNIIKPLLREWHKRFIEPFANVSYGYAITCHKGQGSNFYDVFVDVVDIMKNSNVNEMKHCLYTAVSRTSNELHLLLPECE